MAWWPSPHRPTPPPGPRRRTSACLRPRTTWPAVRTPVTSLRASRCENVSLEITSGPTAGDEAQIQVTPSEGSPSCGRRSHRGGLRLRRPARVRVLLRRLPAHGAAARPRCPVRRLGAAPRLVQGAARPARGGGEPGGARHVPASGAPLGREPLLVALVTASAVALAAIYLAHGFNHRSTVAYLGTAAALVLTGVLASVFVERNFTGLADEEATFLQISAAQVDLSGLLLAGIVIGTLGVLDDVTVTQVSAVWELRETDPDLSGRRLYGSALRIGRDHRLDRQHAGAGLRRGLAPASAPVQPGRPARQRRPERRGGGCRSRARAGGQHRPGGRRSHHDRLGRPGRDARRFVRRAGGGRVRRRPFF